VNTLFYQPIRNQDRLVFFYLAAGGTEKFQGLLVVDLYSDGFQHPEGRPVHLLDLRLVQEALLRDTLRFKTRF